MSNLSVENPAGEDVKHHHLADPRWKHEYLRQCIDALNDPEVEPPRYEPSLAEWRLWAQTMRSSTLVDGHITANHARAALDAWAAVWNFPDLRTLLKAPA
jgi:hypothetical protein